MIHTYEIQSRHGADNILNWQLTAIFFCLEKKFRHEHAKVPLERAIHEFEKIQQNNKVNNSKILVEMWCYPVQDFHEHCLI
jgi:hypothetical protein